MSGIIKAEVNGHAEQTFTLSQHLFAPFYTFVDEVIVWRESSLVFEEPQELVLVDAKAFCRLGERKLFKATIRQQFVEQRRAAVVTGDPL